MRTSSSSVTAVYGVPVPILITIACFIFFGWLLNYTTYGRNTMAIGGNQKLPCWPACTLTAPRSSSSLYTA